jgi:hypothetical protein
MEAPPKPLFDPEKAKRGKAIAAVCALTILATTILQAVPNLHFGNEGLAGELVRIVLVLVCGVGAVQGFTLAVFLVSAYCSLAGTYLFIRSVYNVETVDSYMLTLGVLYFLSAIVLSLSPAVSENNKQRRFRDVPL